MQKYTRCSSLRPAAGSSGDTGDTSPQRLPAPSAGVPEPIRRWHSFHSRRSSVSGGPPGSGPTAAAAASAIHRRSEVSSPGCPTSGAGSPPGAPGSPASSAADTQARFLSPPPLPPLTPRRRFSVWCAQQLSIDIFAKKKNELYLFHLVIDSYCSTGPSPPSPAPIPSQDPSISMGDWREMNRYLHLEQQQQQQQQ